MCETILTDAANKLASARDRVAFLSVTIAQLETVYDDSVTNGLVDILDGIERDLSDVCATVEETLSDNKAV